MLQQPALCCFASHRTLRSDALTGHRRASKPINMQNEAAPARVTAMRIGGKLRAHRRTLHIRQCNGRHSRRGGGSKGCRCCGDRERHSHDGQFHGYRRWVKPLRCGRARPLTRLTCSPLATGRRRTADSITIPQQRLRPRNSWMYLVLLTKTCPLRPVFFVIIDFDQHFFMFWDCKDQWEDTNLRLQNYHVVIYW